MSEYVYVASSWRNPFHAAVVNAIRSSGTAAYDFMRDEGAQFHWSEVDPDYKTWDAEGFLEALSHPRAVRGFESDFGAMKRADTFVLVHPAGRSAHLELGWAVGQGKRTAIYLADGLDDPDLMYKLVDLVTDDLVDLLNWLED